MITYEEAKKRVKEKIEWEMDFWSSDESKEATPEFRESKYNEAKKAFENLDEMTIKYIGTEAKKAVLTPRRRGSKMGISIDINGLGFKPEDEEYQYLKNNWGDLGNYLFYSKKDKFMQMIAKRYDIELPSLRDMDFLDESICNRKSRLEKKRSYSSEYYEEDIKILEDEKKLAIDANIIGGLEFNRSQIGISEYTTKAELDRIYNHIIEKSKNLLEDAREEELKQKEKQEKEKQLQKKKEQEEAERKEQELLAQQRFNESKQKYDNLNVFKKAFYKLTGKAQKVDGQYIVEDNDSEGMRM